MEVGKNLLCLRRDRKIINKAELTRLQRNFEDCMRQVDMLERSKTSKASAAAISIGIIGTMFMAGSVFAVTAGIRCLTLFCVILTKKSITISNLLY